MNQKVVVWSDFFTVDFDAGLLLWKSRPMDHFKTEHGWRIFSGRDAGRIAGYEKDRGYRQVNVNGGRYLVHRILWEMANGPIPDGWFIDHRDRNPRNNSIRNLRLATASENGRNAGVRSSNTSGHVGVCWSKRLNKWMARINHHGRCIHLGVFEDINDAIAARAAAEKKYHGEFAGSRAL